MRGLRTAAEQKALVDKFKTGERGVRTEARTSSTSLLPPHPFLSPSRLFTITTPDPPQIPQPLTDTTTHRPFTAPCLTLPCPSPPFPRVDSRSAHVRPIRARAPASTPLASRRRPSLCGPCSASRSARYCTTRSPPTLSRLSTRPSKCSPPRTSRPPRPVRLTVSAMGEAGARRLGPSIASWRGWKTPWAGGENLSRRWDGTLFVLVLFGRRETRAGDWRSERFTSPRSAGVWNHNGARRLNGARRTSSRGSSWTLQTVPCRLLPRARDLVDDPGVRLSKSPAGTKRCKCIPSERLRRHPSGPITSYTT